MGLNGFYRRGRKRDRRFLWGKSGNVSNISVLENRYMREHMNKKHEVRVLVLRGLKKSTKGSDNV